MSNIIGVLIVDDHAIVREGLRAVIGLENDMQVVGEAKDGNEAISLSRHLNPDVILMDLLMPNKGGIEAIREILEENPNHRILVLTSFAEVDKILPTIRSGALGYIVKNSSPGELLRAIRDIAKGAVYMQPDIARQLFHGLSQSIEPLIQPIEQLSAREIEILKLVAQGMTNEEIGDQLSISSRTVGVHVTHILEKLNLNNRTQAALFALRNGLVSLFSDE
ncbi:MAG TPA: response regulator transcription factor [Anaerolineales bacterium]|nr:response regulator transcription factor [Anaerolineales bacterium]